MEGSNHTDHDPLLPAIHAALKAADNARAAVYSTTCEGDIGHDIHRYACQLERRLSNYDIFKAGEDDLIRSAADKLGQLATDEERIEVIADACCAGGGYSRTILTPQGGALRDAERALRMLAGAITAVHHTITAERIAAQLSR